MQRDDDKEEVVRNRMEVFDNTINPVLDFYRKQGKLVEIDANQDLGVVYESVSAEIN